MRIELGGKWIAEKTKEDKTSKTIRFFIISNKPIKKTT
jgi:hypothetical protein